MNKMSNWLLAKMINYLQHHEGCRVLGNIKESGGCSVLMKDSLGYRYEVTIKCLSRDVTDPFTLDGKPVVFKITNKEMI